MEHTIDIDSQLKQQCKQFKDKLIELINTSIVMYIYNKLNKIDSADNIYEIMRLICDNYDTLYQPLPKVDGEELSLNDPENIMQVFIIYLRDFYVDLLNMIDHLLFDQCAKIDPLSLLDTGTIIQTLIVKNRLSPSVAKEFSCLLMHPKFKIGLSLLFICSFIFHVNDKSIFPGTLPKQMHEFDFWFSTDIVQYVNSHSDPFIRKEMISSSITEDGKAFIASLFRSVLCRFILKVNVDVYLCGFESYIEFGLEIALLLHTLKDECYDSIVSVYSTLPMDKVMKVLQMLISNYDQIEHKKYFVKIAKMIFGHSKASMEESIAALVNANWNNESIANLIVYSQAPENLGKIVESMLDIMTSPYTETTTLNVAIDTLNKIYEISCEVVEEQIDDKLIFPLRSICLTGKNGEDASITTQAQIVQFQCPDVKQIEEVIDCIKLISERLFMQSYYNIMVQPIFKLYCAITDTESLLYKSCEELLLLFLSRSDNASSLIRDLFSNGLDNYTSALTQYQQSPKESLVKQHNNLVKTMSSIESKDGKLLFKYSTVELEEYLTKCLSDDYFEKLMETTNQAMQLLSKIELESYKSIIPYIYQCYLEEMLKDSKEGTICDLSEPIEISANAEVYRSIKCKHAEYIVTKLLSTYDHKFLFGSERYEDILICIISSNDQAKLLKALKVADQLLATSQISKEGEQFMIDVYPYILALCVSPNDNIEKLSLALNNIIVYSFRDNISNLIEENKNKVIDIFISIISNECKQSTEYILAQLSDIVQYSGSTLPFDCIKLQCLWDTMSTHLSNDLLKESQSTIAKLALFYPDDFLIHVSGILNKLSQSNDKIEIYLQLIQKLLDDEKFQLNDMESPKQYIESLSHISSKSIAIAASSLRSLSALIKHVSPTLKSVILPIVYTHCSSLCVEAQREALSTFKAILRTWPVESLFEELAQIREHVKTASACDDSCVKELCKECENILKACGID